MTQPKRLWDLTQLFIQRAPLGHEAWERSHFSMSQKCSSITSCLFSDSDCFLFWQVECAVHNPEPHINTDSTADTPVLGHGCVWVRNVFPHLSEHNLLFHSEALVLMSSAPPTLDEAFCLNSCVFHKINCDCPQRGNHRWGFSPSERTQDINGPFPLIILVLRQYINCC